MSNATLMVRFSIAWNVLPECYTSKSMGSYGSSLPLELAITVMTNTTLPKPMAIRRDAYLLEKSNPISSGNIARCQGKGLSLVRASFA